MADSVRRPRVTFYVIAYNQARFIRQAVESALAQTFSPMEILLSDDCSTDGTFEIIQEVVKGYSGPHKIVLNRNNRTLGLSEHANRIMELATGELIIAADGDDVSDPHRTDRCVEVWLKNGRPAALASSVLCIDAAGNPSRTKNGDRWFAEFLAAENETPSACLLRFSKHGSPRLVSCSAAWTKEMFTAFGPLAPGVWFEDDVMTLRAWLFDRIVFIQESLVSYRSHDSNMFNRVQPATTSVHSRKHAEQATRTEARHRRESLVTFMPDLELALRQQWITRSLFEELKRELEIRCTLHRVIEDWWHIGCLERLALLPFLVRSGRLRELRWCISRLLPYPVFLALGAIWSRARMIGSAGWSVFVTVSAVPADVMSVLCGA